MLVRAFEGHGAPAAIRSDNGSQFVASEVVGQLEEICAAALYMQPGKPWKVGFCESLNGRPRDERLYDEDFLEHRAPVPCWRGLESSTRQSTWAVRSVISESPASLSQIQLRDCGYPVSSRVGNALPGPGGRECSTLRRREEPRGSRVTLRACTQFAQSQSRTVRRAVVRSVSNYRVRGRVVSRIRDRANRPAWIVSGATLALALGGVMFALHTRPFFDETQYWQMGRNLLDTGVYSLTLGGPPTAFKVPGVPLLLAATQAMGFGFTESRVLFVLLLLPLGVWLAWRMLASIGIPPVASAWAVVFAFANPALVASSGTLYPQFAVGVAYLAAIVAWNASERRDAIGSRMLLALAAGLALGLAVMLASTAAIVVAAMFLWVLWRAWHRSARGESPLGPQLVAAGVVAIGICVVLAPWLIRNSIVAGRFPLMGTSGGITLLAGNSPASTVENGPEVRFPAEDTPPAGSSEVAQDQFYRGRALEHIRREPLYYGRLYLAKVAYGVWPTAVTATSGSNLLGDVVQRLYYGLLYLLLLMWVLFEKRLSLAQSWIADAAPYLRLGLLMAIVSVLSYAVFFTRLRYRLPTDVPLGLFAGLSVYLLSASGCAPLVGPKEHRGSRSGARRLARGGSRSGSVPVMTCLIPNYPRASGTTLGTHGRGRSGWRGSGTGSARSRGRRTRSR